MKKKIVSMALMVVLCFVLAMSAFAEGVQYKTGDYVAYSGHTDFGYYFTYSVEKTNTNYKCFSVVAISAFPLWKMGSVCMRL